MLSHAVICSDDQMPFENIHFLRCLELEGSLEKQSSKILSKSLIPILDILIKLSQWGNNMKEIENRMRKQAID